MFMGTPAEEPFRLLVWIFIGIPFIFLILWPLTSLVLTFLISAVALQAAITVAIVGYIVGIPWAIWRRAVTGEWPDGG